MALLLPTVTLLVPFSGCSCGLSDAVADAVVFDDVVADNICDVSC